MGPAGCRAFIGWHDLLLSIATCLFSLCCTEFGWLPRFSLAPVSSRFYLQLDMPFVGRDNGRHRLSAPWSVRRY